MVVLGTTIIVVPKRRHVLVIVPIWTVPHDVSRLTAGIANHFIHPINLLKLNRLLVSSIFIIAIIIISVVASIATT